MRTRGGDLGLYTQRRGSRREAFGTVNDKINNRRRHFYEIARKCNEGAGGCGAPAARSTGVEPGGSARRSVAKDWGRGARVHRLRGHAAAGGPAVGGGWARGGRAGGRGGGG